MSSQREMADDGPEGSETAIAKREISASLEDELISDVPENVPAVRLRVSVVHLCCLSVRYEV